MTCTLQDCLGRLPWDGRCLLLLGQHRSWLTFPPGDAKFQVDIFVEIIKLFLISESRFGPIFWIHFLTPGSRFGAVFGYQNWCQGIP